VSRPIARRAAIALPALALPALHARAQGAGQGAREFRLGTITPAHHTWNVAARNFGEELRTASGGRFSVAQFPSGQLGNEATMLQQLQTGALDMSFMTTAEITNRVDAFGALHAPFVAASVQGAIAMLRSAPALGLMGMLPQTVGCIGVRYGMTGLRQILTRASVTTLADIRGQKIRITPAAPIRDFYTMIGTAPVPLPLPQVFDALANGQIDGLELDFESVVNGRFQELARTMLLSNHSAFPMVGLVSGRTWAGLAPADREMVRALMAKHIDAQADGMIQVEVDNLARLRQSAMAIRPVGAEFFGDAVAQWDRAWGPRAPALAALRALPRA
jgi:TRAP-type C4-dicarboxylate transport system substrate-binding protein